MSPARMSRLENSIRLVLQFNEAFNRHDVAGMMQLVSADCAFEDRNPAPDGTRYSGKEAVTRFWEDFFQKTPGAHSEIEDIFSLGLRCVMRSRCDWLDAFGKQAHVRGVDLFLVKEGLISERLSYVKG
jgi:limonene-1,2-epoxide hydrolase